MSNWYDDNNQWAPWEVEEILNEIKDKTQVIKGGKDDCNGNRTQKTNPDELLWESLA